MDDNQKASKDSSEEVVGAGVDSSGIDTANAILDIEQLINSTLVRIEELSKNTSELNEMVTSVLENDETYLAHSEVAKEAARVKNATKSEIVKRPEVASTMDKVREVRTDLKDAKDALSGYLYEYSRLSGTDEFEGQDGVVRRIVLNAKLVKG